MFHHVAAAVLLLVLLCVMQHAAATVSSLSVFPSDSYCNSTNPSLNRCSDFVQAFIGECCASPTVTHCNIQFGPGTFYLQTVTVNPGAVSAFYWAPQCAANLLSFSGAGPSLSSQQPATSLVIMDLIGFFQASGKIMQPTSSGPSVTFSFSNLTIDMLRVPYSFGVAVGQNTVKLAAAQVQGAAFAIDVDRWPFLNAAQAINTYSMAESRWTPGLDDYRLADPATLTYGPTDPVTGDVVVTLGPSSGSSGGVPPPNLTALLGQTIILRHQVYSINGFSASYAALRIASVELYSIGGMGVVCTRCFDIVMDRLRISRPGIPLPSSAR